MPALQKLPARTSQFHFFLLTIAAVFSFACSATKGPGGPSSAGATNTPPAATQATPSITASSGLNNAAGLSPQLSEVQDAVKRISVDAITIDTNQSRPFIVGDFNGDDSQDLAVIVRPVAGALPKINSEYANWIIEDPRKVVLPDPDKGVQRLPKPAPPVVVQASDVLLLVLHGYQQAGWRHQYARQTFLLRNAVGENFRAQTVSDASKASGDKNLPPQRAGDVIGEKLTGRDGYLFWTNGRYVWHE